MAGQEPLVRLSEVRDEPRDRFLRDLDIQLPLAVCLALYGFLYALLTFTHPFSHDTYTALSDVGGVLPPMVAGALALFAGERAARHVGFGWRLIGAGCLCWGAGELVWTFYEVVLRNDVPFPSWADAGYLTMLPLVAAGLIVLSAERRHLVHARPTLDGIAIVLTVVALVWYFVLHPTYAQSDTGPLEKVIGAAYPVGDLIVVYALVVALQRQWDIRNAFVMAMVLTGMAMITAADLGFAYLTLQDGYDSTSLSSSFVNLGWPLGFLVISYAAALGSNWSLAYDGDESLPSPGAWRQALPLLLLPPLIVLTTYAAMNDSLAVSAPLVAITATASVAALVRLLISLGMLHEVETSTRQAAVVIDQIRNRSKRAA